MRILNVIDSIKTGGAEQVFIDIIKLLKKAEIIEQNDALLLIQTPKNEIDKLTKYKISVIELNRKFRFDVLKLYETSRILIKYDIIHVHMRHNLRYICFVNFVFNLNLKIIFHDHHFVTHIPLLRKLFLYKITKPTFYIGVCKETQVWAKEVWKIKSCDTTCLINLPRFDLSMGNTKWSGGDGLVYVSNIKPQKNQIFAAEFAETVNKKIEFIGNNQNVTYFNLLNKKYNSIIHEKVTNPIERFSEFQFGVFSSYNESGPLVVLEYFVSGLPFIAYKTGGISDILHRYVPQFFLDKLILNDWVDRYYYLLGNYSRIEPDLVDYVIKKEFCQDRYLYNLLEVYKNAKTISY